MNPDSPRNSRLFWGCFIALVTSYLAQILHFKSRGGYRNEEFGKAWNREAGPGEEPLGFLRSINNPLPQLPFVLSRDGFAAHAHSRSQQS
jgi:hypothetical protein